MDLKSIKKTLNNNIEPVFKKLDIQYEIFDDNIYSTCPVHENSDNPRAFSFSISKGIWKCWTRNCQEHYGNDIFGLIKGCLDKKNGGKAEFIDAVNWSKNLLNIKSHTKKHTKSNIEENAINEDLYYVVDILNKNIIETEKSPVDIESYNIPSKYFLGRGFQKDTLIYFGVGDCDNKSSKLYDRSIIPVFDDHGQKIIATIARSIKEYKLPKFLINPKGVKKTDLLYNIDKAIESIHQTKTVFLLEGQGDVWRLYEAGIKNAISIFGKSLSDGQIKKLQKLPITTIVVLTDNDQAGKEAKVQIKRQLGRMYNLIFPKISKKDIGEMTVKEINEQIVPQVKGYY
jgi:5S rRNA maturation endonuclease (ribonuclease M5)